MKEHQLLKQVIISQDSGWYHVGEPDGGTFNDYSYLLTDFLPALQQNGFTAKDIQTLLVENPAKALTVGVRTRKY